MNYLYGENLKLLIDSLVIKSVIKNEETYTFLDKLKRRKLK